MTPEQLALLMAVARLCHQAEDSSVHHQQDRDTGALAPREGEGMTPDNEARRPGLTARLDKLSADVAELRDGQDELLRMFEELGKLYPKDCLCAEAKAEAARREFLRDGVFVNELPHEDFVPGDLP